MSKRIFNATAADLIVLLSCEDSISNETLSWGTRQGTWNNFYRSCVFVLDEGNSGKIAIPVWATKNISKAFSSSWSSQVNVSFKEINLDSQNQIKLKYKKVEWYNVTFVKTIKMCILWINLAKWS